VCAIGNGFFAQFFSPSFRRSGYRLPVSAKNKVFSHIKFFGVKGDFSERNPPCGERGGAPRFPPVFPFVSFLALFSFIFCNFSFFFEKLWYNKRVTMTLPQKRMR
jgi:hypothetical protein